MPINEAEFDNEAELDTWVQANHTLFLPDSIFVSPFKITTPSGKGGVPDGFVFNLNVREWFTVECELLRHGVWPHIAEQITRFVVALQNASTLRLIRDKLFEQILATDSLDECAQKLGTTRERFLQELELFIEAVRPGIVIFIDDTNQDLTDFAHAIDLPTRIYRVKKLISDGTVQYYSPDHHPVVETEPVGTESAGDTTLVVLDMLGGGKVHESSGRFRCYELADGRKIHVKYSKLHERQNYFWYGVPPAVIEKLAEQDISEVVFILGDRGFVTVPVEVVNRYIQETKTSTHPDGSIRHYHILISNDPEPVLYWSSDTPRFQLADQFTPFG